MTRSLAPWRPPDPYSYSWLLGFYLGDGCVASSGRTFQLRVVLDGAYPGVIDECATAAKLVLPDARLRIRPRPTDGGVIVEMASPLWAEIFPQHGPGRKHLKIYTNCLPNKRQT